MTGLTLVKARNYMRNKLGNGKIGLCYVKPFHHIVLNESLNQYDLEIITKSIYEIRDFFYAEHWYIGVFEGKLIISFFN